MSGSSGALFGGPTARTQSKNLVEFRAGKMFMKGKMVHPDKRKGLVYVYQSDDSLMHFCWKDRSKASPESQDDLIIFPDDVEFKHVPQCTTGRVYVLKFKTSSRKLFFWMQEPKSDKDEEFCRKVNENLNNPPAPGSNRGGGGGSGGGLGGLPPELAAGLGGGSDLQNILGHMSQQELMQLLGGMGVGGMGGLSALMGGRSSSQAESAPPSRVQSSPGPRVATPQMPAISPAAPRPVTAAALPTQAPSSDGKASASTANKGATAAAKTPAGGSTGTPTPTGGSTGTGGATGSSATAAAAAAAASKIQLSDLQSILSGMGGGKDAIDLSKAITPESMIPILANADIQERLLQFLPEGEKLPRTEGELRNTISSPQFQQAMNSFSAALASGQLGPLMAQFNLGDDVANAAAQGDVEAFARAMQSGLQKNQEKPSEDAEMKDAEEKKD